MSRVKKLSTCTILIVLLSSCALNNINRQGVGLLLQACSKAPRCVSSELDRSNPKYIEPIKISGSLLNVQVRLIKQIKEMGGVITHSDTHYLSATFSSRVFGFVDDLDVRIDFDDGLVHVRSGARIGYYDFEVNRKRVNDLRERMRF